MGDEGRAAIDWQPPTAFGLDNSLRLADAAAAAGVGILPSVQLHIHLFLPITSIPFVW